MFTTIRLVAEEKCLCNQEVTVPSYVLTVIMMILNNPCLLIYIRKVLFTFHEMSENILITLFQN